MAKAARPDPLAPPPGGWPAEPCGSNAERLAFAKWLWARPASGSERTEYDDPGTVDGLLRGSATQLLNDLRNRAQLPTMAEHRDRLRELAATAGKLRAQLHYFSGADGVLRFRATQSAHARQAALSRLAKPYGFDFLEHLEPFLIVMEEMASEELEDIPQVASGSGHTRLHDRLFGDPRASLVARSAQLVATVCGAAQVKTTDGGIVHRVAHHIWADATGLAPDDYNLASFLKQGVRIFRNGPAGRTAKLFPTALNRAKNRRLPP